MTDIAGISGKHVASAVEGFAGDDDDPLAAIAALLVEARRERDAWKKLVVARTADVAAAEAKLDTLQAAATDTPPESVRTEAT